MALIRTLLLIFMLLNITISPSSTTSLNRLGRHHAGRSTSLNRLGRHHAGRSECPSQDVINRCSSCKEVSSSNEVEILKSFFWKLSTSEAAKLCSQAENSKINTGPSAFTVELSSTRSLSNEVPITFDRILVDSSDSFVPLLGTFLCPDDDVYSFYWSIHVPQGGVSAVLVQQGETVKVGPLTSEMPGKFSGTSSMSTILQCTEGSMVWLKAHAWPDEKACNEIEEVYSSFTGFKVFGSADNKAVGFTAELSLNTSMSSPIIYDNVLVNIGGDYDQGTGKFTCSSDGVYVFTVSAHVTSQGTDTYLRKNGATICKPARPFNTWSRATDSGTATGTCIIVCEKGDNITVTSTKEREHMAQVSSFSGYKLVDTENSTVAFMARQTSDSEAYIDGQTFIFDYVITNLGGHYFPTFGTFICPDTELYIFFWSVMQRYEINERPAEARLMSAKDEVINEVKAGPKTSEVLTGSYGHSSSTQAVVRCEPDRAIYVQAVIADSETQHYHHAYQTFGGFRLPKV